MSEPIKVGDLVVQVRACCDYEYKRSPCTGVPYRVQELPTRPALGCHRCGFYGDLLIATGFHGTHAGVYVGWLQRIPPLEELDDVKRDEEINA
jgi:hypothetical protein